MLPLLFEGLDLPLVLGPALHQLSVFFHGEHWVFIAILGYLPPALYLLLVHPPRSR